MFVLDMFFANQVSAAPEVLIFLTVFLLYYHIAHIIYGLGSLIYYFRKIKIKFKMLNWLKQLSAFFNHQSVL